MCQVYIRVFIYGWIFLHHKKKEYIYIYSAQMIGILIRKFILNLNFFHAKIFFYPSHANGKPSPIFLLKSWITQQLWYEPSWPASVFYFYKKIHG